MSAKKDTDKDRTYELYLEERRVLVQAQRDTAASFDKAVLTLASGAFAVSIVFLKDIVLKPYPNTLWLLGGSWGLFALSLITILTGFLASQMACTRQIDVCEEKLLRNVELTNGWATTAHVCNWASIAMLVGAFWFSGRFVYWNYMQPH